MVTALYAADEPPRFGYPEALAAAIHQVAPVYPEKVRPLKIESNIAIDAYVETDGSVYSTIIVWGDPKLIYAAEAAAKQWKFTPFMENGHPSRAIARLLFHMTPPSLNRASR
jgi:outer membrane biosynthesis protein TonB